MDLQRPPCFGNCWIQNQDSIYNWHAWRQSPLLFRKSLNPQGIYNAAEVVKPFYMPVSEVCSEPKNSIAMGVGELLQWDVRMWATGHQAASRPWSCGIPRVARCNSDGPRRTRRSPTGWCASPDMAFKRLRGKRHNLSLSSSRDPTHLTYAYDSGDLTVRVSIHRIVRDRVMQS